MKKRKKNKKNKDMVANNIKISMKMKNRLVQYRKKHYKVWQNRITSQIKSDSCFLASNQTQNFFWINM